MPQTLILNRQQGGGSANNTAVATATGTAAPTPTASTTPAASPTPALPSAVFADNFTGHYYHNFGTIDFSQSGTDLTGTYTNGPLGSSGTIKATVSGYVATGSYKIGASTGKIVFTKTGDTFMGTYNDTYRWCGAKVGVAFPSECGFNRHWFVNYGPGVGSQCEMDLHQTSLNVTGTYCNGSVSGSISFTGGYQKLNGTWTTKLLTSGAFSYYLANLGSSNQQKWFQGHYDTSAPATYQWCGGYTIANQPQNLTPALTCLK